MDPMNLETRYSKDCSEVEETGKPSTICLPSTKLPVRYADHIRNIPVTNVSSVVHKSGAKLSFWPENELPAKCHDNCGKGVTKEMIEETLDYSRDSVHQVCITSTICVPSCTSHYS